MYYRDDMIRPNGYNLEQSGLRYYTALLTIYQINADIKKALR